MQFVSKTYYTANNPDVWHEPVNTDKFEVCPLQVHYNSTTECRDAIMEYFASFSQKQLIDFYNEQCYLEKNQGYEIKDVTYKDYINDGDDDWFQHIMFSAMVYKRQEKIESVLGADGKTYKCIVEFNKLVKEDTFTIQIQKIELFFQK